MVEQHIAEGDQGAALGLLGLQVFLQLADLRFTGLQARLGTLGGGLLDILLGGTQRDGLLGELDAALGEIRQLVDLLLVGVIGVGARGLLHHFAGILGFQRGQLRRARIALQLRVIAASLLELHVGLGRAGGKSDAQCHHRG